MNEASESPNENTVRISIVNGSIVCRITGPFDRVNSHMRLRNELILSCNVTIYTPTSVLYYIITISVCVRACLCVCV